MRLRRISVISGLAVMAGAVGLAATAWACTALATLEPATTTTSAGANVAVAGSGFAAKGAGPVVVHWGGVAGPVVGQGTADASGNVNVSVAVPDAAPGQYVLVATQAKSNGEAVYGTPARASIGVKGPDGVVPASPAAATPDTPAPAASATNDGGLPSLTLVLAAVGLALFGAGFIALNKGGKSRPAAAPARRG